MSTIGKYAELTGAQAPVEGGQAQSDAVQSNCAKPKTFRVLFADTTWWQALIVAPDEATAMEIAEANWNRAGHNGFSNEQCLDIASDGSLAEHLEAEEVLS